ncbi:BTB/POZ domain-containing protein [Capsicum annuum]|uniref:BTB/POZ domain-containing protein At1g63850 n=1 Tax=Capsicum annuum TaxID=4072 RepID=UPI001FB0F7BE|nr:BTB/POZ domain-containing protein At1g63850 [Capsicum annuum]KAF3649626.1 BTB/POZ domain-containing protein [Capsicum annuum]KAF3668889.1 BTB/POZ domain-containing protein [Capsicum annuum]
MANTTTTTTTTNLKFQIQHIKPKRRRCRETTITTTTRNTNPSNSSPTDCSTKCLNETRVTDTPTIVSPDNSWCFQVSKSAAPPPSPPPQLPFADTKIRYSPTTFPGVMESLGSNSATLYGGGAGGGGTPVTNNNTHEGFPSSFSKFNSALTAGLLNPMSPPPSMDNKTRSSPTLFEMMANEPECITRSTINTPILNNTQNQKPSPFIQQDKHALMQQRLLDLLACRSPGNQFNDSGSSDVKLSLSSKDGLSVAMNVHRQILVVHSRFFAVKLSEKWVKQQRNSGPYIVEIADCDDIEVYIETLRLMYCKDLRRRLMKEDVSKVLGILKVSAAIGFDAGVLSCLEYLEAAPWAEDEEEKVASLLSELRLEGVAAGEVLRRVSLDVTSGTESGNGNEEVLLKLLHVVLEGKDEKARREMKGLVSRMLHENSSHNDLRKESLYSACNACLQLLRHHFLRAADADMMDVGQIARQADNLHWILDILIDRQIAEDFLRTWASQSELSAAHPKVPALHRYEVSRVTARLFVGIGKGQLLASKDARCSLLQTWLVPFYEDFGWMRRASRGLDRHLIEDGLSNTILTLPMVLQQEILMSWFDRFLNSGDDCPNIQRGFEIWWRRAFWKRNGEPERSRQMRVMTATIEHS